MIFPSLKSFRNTERGSISVETVISLPILFYALVATSVFFDAFKTYNMGQKASFTVADMLSREEAAIDDVYMARMGDLYKWLSNSEREYELSTTVVSKVIDPDTGFDKLELIWSRDANGDIAHTDLDALRDRIPDMAVGDQLIVVEGLQSWTPAFQIGVPSTTFRQIVVSRPRFAPQLTWKPDDIIVAAN